jgi:DNA-binding NarL/FixJ family response regulator
VEAARAIRKEFPARLIALTSYGGDEDIRRALAAGVRAYLTKHVLGKELLQTIRIVFAGGIYLPPALEAVLESQRDSPALSQRKSKSWNSLPTAKNHVQHIFQKLGAQDRTRAATAVIERCIIHL